MFELILFLIIFFVIWNILSFLSSIGDKDYEEEDDGYHVEKAIPDTPWKIVLLSMVNDELDDVKRQLKETYDVVDNFVFCESNLTFSGKEKPFHLKNELEEWSDKVKIVSLTLPNSYTRSEERLIHQQEMLIRETYNFTTKTIFIYHNTYQHISKSIITKLKNMYVNHQEPEEELIQLPLETHYFGDVTKCIKHDTALVFRGIHLNPVRYNSFQGFILNATKTYYGTPDRNGSSYRWSHISELRSKQITSSCQYLKYRNNPLNFERDERKKCNSIVK